MTIALEKVKKILPHCPAARIDALFPHLSGAMSEGQIYTPIREAAFLAQLAHESGEFRWMEEIASGEAYEGRMDLGNSQPGDGKRFKGRGPIQITGRANYKAAGDALLLDLVTHPEQASLPSVGFRLAVWFWTSRGLNVLADAIPASPDPAHQFDSITRKINGGLNGKAQRDAYFAQARLVLGC